MSQSNSKAQRKAEQEKIKKELVEKIEQGTIERDRVLEQHKGGLVNLFVGSSKNFLSVNGYVQARDALEFAGYKGEELHTLAIHIARMVSQTFDEIADKLKEIEVDDINQDIFDEYVKEDFINTEFDINDVAYELLIFKTLGQAGEQIHSLMAQAEGSKMGLETMQKNLEEIAKGPKVKLAPEVTD